jgi:pimeloyl-ACP methyl ester carboxylesterase
VVLFGFTPSPEYHILPVPAPRVAPRVRNTADAAASDFITPQVTPPAVVRAFVAQALAADPIFAEWKDEHQWSVLRAEKLTVPVMIIHGENDPGADPKAAGEFLAAAGSHSRSYVVLPLADHCAQLEDTHDAFVSAVVEFVVRK